MDTKELRIQHLRIIIAALKHAALLAKLGREASEGTPDTFLFDAARKAIRDFRDLHPTIAELWHEPAPPVTADAAEAPPGPTPK